MSKKEEPTVRTKSVYLYLKKDYTDIQVEQPESKEYKKIKASADNQGFVYNQILSLTRIIKKVKNTKAVSDALKLLVDEIIEKDGMLKFNLTGTSGSKVQIRISPIEGQAKNATLSLQETNGPYIERMKEVFEIRMIYFALAKALTVKLDYYGRIDKDILSSSIYASSLHLFRHSE